MECWQHRFYNLIQFISLSIDPLQGVNHMDVENSHRICQNIQSSTIQLDTLYVSWFTYLYKKVETVNDTVCNDNVYCYTYAVSKNI